MTTTTSPAEPSGLQLQHLQLAAAFDALVDELLDLAAELGSSTARDRDAAVRLRSIVDRHTDAPGEPEVEVESTHTCAGLTPRDRAHRRCCCAPTGSGSCPRCLACER